MISNEEKLAKINQYIEAYNNYNVNGMLQPLDNHISFANITNDYITLTTQGKPDFEIQAIKALDLFKNRNQKIESITFNDESVIVDISYTAIVNYEIPYELNIGEKVSIKGKSIFTFKDDKIIDIRDVINS
ncbi:nuclear transport factor 2-like protein [Marinigracilibium pacificum]|uniref:Nuclear transport factor 2 family protein n=1 Tax=Marinigracilibium pacificum TaxID=2729599 RepID=A0A848J3N1_9BACT|nr:nuclear transport factor 2 family protein [Marinigracilibium pacificum]NMM47782.1 nuclear transport factor 2 family protein [Marinigracilibium pacificum]